jgi:hypothetical protein
MMIMIPVHLVKAKKSHFSNEVTTSIRITPNGFEITILNFGSKLRQAFVK